MKKQISFPFGVSYAPYAKSEDLPMEEWEGDFQTMQKLGINTMRGFVAWDRIETDDGVYDDRKLDRLFELGEKYGISIILNVGGAFSNLCGIYPPHWLVLSGRCQEVVKLDHSDFFGPRRFLCMDDPVYQQFSRDFISRIVKRYRDRPNLLAWSVWNEPLIAYPCCCKHTLALFHEFLKKKYHGDLAELNRIWGTEFPISYRSWDEVEPGVEAGFGGGYLANLDWKEFIEEKIVRLIQTENQLIKSLDPAHPTTINIVTHAETDRFYRNNLHAIARSVDIAGYSHYLLNDEPYQAALSLDRLRCASREDGHFYILETEAGPHFYLDPHYQRTSEGECRIKNHWQSVARGVRMILLWKYRGRVSDKQTDEYNLVAWDGSVTDRAKRNAACAADLNRIASELECRVLRSEVALFTPQSTRKYVELDNGTPFLLNRYTESIEGAYKFFYDRNIPVDFLCEQDLLDGNLDARYKLLIIPFGVVIDKTSAKTILDFAEQGGTVLADEGCAMQTTDCHTQFRAPGYDLQKLFGCYFNDLLSKAANPEERVNFGNVRLEATDGFARLYPEQKTDVLAVYADGQAAMVGHAFGKGTGILCGISIFQSYLKKETTVGIAEFLNTVLKRSGVESTFAFGRGEADNGVELCELTVPGQPEAKRFIVAINHRKEPFNDALILGGRTVSSFSELRSGCEIQLTANAFSLHLGPEQAMILREK